MLCPNCHESNPEGAEFCLNCGTKLENTFSGEVKSIISAARMESRYSGMKNVATVYHVLGWIVTILTLFIAFRAYEISGEAMAVIVVFIIGSIPANILHSNGDRLNVLVDTELNTRQTTEYLRLILDLLNRNLEG